MRPAALSVDMGGGSSTFPSLPASPGVKAGVSATTSHDLLRTGEGGELFGMPRAHVRGRVQGRITERQLPLAERSFPGISQFYASLENKPATFLQLVWAFEGRNEAPATPRKRRRS